MADRPLARVEEGLLQGKTEFTSNGKIYYAFQGIPYAKPPIGSLRFKDPQPAEPWEGTRDATEEANFCAQKYYDRSLQKEVFIGGEDCLYLNVFTPNHEAVDLPVMFWSHAGFFQNGSGNSDTYSPKYFMEHDVIIVTINYRLGPLGFMCLHTSEVPGNAGLKDQALALKWVKDNIINFGGNPDDITVFGSSAGAASASFLSISPVSKDMISKVILQSGTALNKWSFSRRDPVKVAADLARILGFESTQSPEDIQNALESVGVKELIEAASMMHDIQSLFEDLDVFEPILERNYPGKVAFLDENPAEVLATGRQAKVPVMIGSNAQEALFLLGLPKFYIENDLRKFIPKSFKLHNNSEEAVSIANQLRDFYFGDKPLNMESLQQYINLMTDSLFAADIDRYINLLTVSSSVPIYHYRFSYYGDGNINKALAENFGIKSAAHLDEIAYLFENKPLFDEDEVTKDRMVKMWTNFAKFGNPIPEESDILKSIWPAVEANTKYCLEIGEELSLKTDIDGERMRLWQDLYGKYYAIWNEKSTESSPAKSLASAHSIDTNDQDTQTPKETNGEIPDSPTDTIEDPTEAPDSPTNDAREPDEEKQAIETIEEVIQSEESKYLSNNNSPIKASHKNGDIIRANDPQEDDLPRNIGVNQFVNFFEALGGKK